MSKRIIALLLCAVMLIPCLASCASKNEDDPGAYITMYLTDDIYDFDPANAFYNKDTLNVVTMLYDTLFTLDKKGKVKESLVEKYVIKEDKEKGEYTMELTLKETSWSNGTPVSADDVVFAWKRLINQDNDFAAASLLYDIKNARAIKESDMPIDDLGVEAVAAKVVKITFEGPINYDQFLLNLTSVATAPLYENYVIKNEDWAKKPSTMVTSGPYRIGKVNYRADDSKDKVFDDYAFDYYYYGLPNPDDNGKKPNREKGELGSGEYDVLDINFFYLERNVYYCRDTEDDALDKYVKNYRILVDCTMTDEEILKAYQNGELFYIGDIPMSLRSNAFVQENVEVTDALSTFSLMLNEEALIDDGTKEGSKLFAIKEVRQALSLALDRQAIASAVVYAKAATALVPNGVFNEAKKAKNDFRTVGGDLIATTANVAQAQALLSAAGITPSQYTFSVSVSAKDDVNVAIATKVVEAWSALGFNVTLDAREVIVNNDYSKETLSIPNDVGDDLFQESIRRKTYEVAAFDYVAYSADAYSMLSSFALSFSGMSLDDNYNLTPGVTGYNSEAYNDLIEAVYFIPYFASLNENSSSFLGLYDTPEEFKTVYNKVKAIYDAHGITPTTSSKKWAEQKAILLHAAEKLLVEEMPIIPVVFNQNAVLQSKDLSKVTPTYYIPAHFQKTKLKNYEDYVPVFESFPAIDWSKKGLVIEEEA